MKNFKKNLIILGVFSASLTANAQLAESLGVTTVPLDVIEGRQVDTTKQVQNANQNTSKFTEKFIDNGYHIPGNDYKSNNISSYEGLVGVQGMYGRSGSSSGSAGSGSSSNNAENIAIAGAVGAGAYALAQTELGKSAIEAGKNLISGNDTAVQGAAKALDISSDALGTATGIGGPPQVALLFGPTPNGDVFSFCNGPRPHWKSPWFSPYVYLCDGNPKKPGASFIGFGVK